MRFTADQTRELSPGSGFKKNNNNKHGKSELKTQNKRRLKIVYYTRDRERGNICGGQSGETPGLIRVKTSLIRAVNEL